MKKILRGISISHELASSASRECYHLNETAIGDLMDAIQSNFADIRGLIILSTCNRTEVYFESIDTSTLDMVNFFIKKFAPEASAKKEVKKFHCYTNTFATAYHLMQLANGLKSALVGDRQILSQLKQAYRYSLDRSLQGSLLERVFQAVFRSHKKVYPITFFKKSVGSTGYAALKQIEQNLGQSEISSKKLLIIGAGSVVVDVLKHLHKFPFASIFIANRTEKKAVKLARQYHVEVFQWKRIEAGDYAHFDGIITAVSNRKNLISENQAQWHKPLVIVDLALPSNVSVGLCRDKNVTIYNIDELTRGMSYPESFDLEEMASVNQLLASELQRLEKWLKEADTRYFLRDYKAHILKLLYQTFQHIPDLNPNQEEIDLFVNRMVRKIIKKRSSVAIQGERGEHLSSGLGPSIKRLAR